MSSFAGVCAMPPDISLVCVVEAKNIIERLKIKLWKSLMMNDNFIIKSFLFYFIGKKFIDVSISSGVLININANCCD